MPLLFGQALERAFKRLGWYAADQDAQEWMKPGGVVVPADLRGWQQTTIMAAESYQLATGRVSEFTLVEGYEIDPVECWQASVVVRKKASETWAGSVALWWQRLVPAPVITGPLTPSYDLAKVQHEEVDSRYTLIWRPPSPVWFSGGYRLFARVSNAMNESAGVDVQVFYNAYPGARPGGLL